MYSYSGATKAYSDEGGETVSNWKTATSDKAILSDMAPLIIEVAPQFEETLGSADILVKDNLTVGLKDKFTINSIDFQVDKIDKTAMVNDIVVVQGITLHKMES